MYTGKTDSQNIVTPFAPGLTNLLDKLLRMTPRKTLLVHLVPENDLVADSKNSDAWWSKGDAPSFNVHGNADLFKKGWLYIEGVLQRYCLSKAKLYYDVGHGFSESNLFIIPVTRRGNIRELVYLPAGVVGLKWAPVDSIGFFIQNILTLTRISRFEAVLRAAYRVVYDINRFLKDKERRSSTIKKLLVPLLKMQLWKAYHNTISFRVFDGTSRTNTELFAAYTKTMLQNLPEIVNNCKQLNTLPLISVVIPFSALVEHTILSLQNQIYTSWELHIVCDITTCKAEVSALSARYHDDRIRITYPGEKCDILFDRARYVVFVSSGVRIEPHGLFRLVQVFQSNNADFVYADGVLESDDGAEVVEFDCRPLFSLELLRSHQYIKDFVAFDQQFYTALVKPDEIMSAHQLYALLLRAAELAATIVHVPEFLYRVIGGKSDSETATAANQVPYSGILQQHLQRSGYGAEVEEHPECRSFRRVKYKLGPGMRIAVIIPTKNAGQLVRQCVASLSGTISKAAYDIFIIDHDSQEPESLCCFEMLSAQHTILQYGGAFNFSRINNWAVRQLPGLYSHYLFCNNDIEAIHPGWLETMLGFGQMKDVGVVGAQLLYPDRVHIQHAGVCVGLHGLAEHYGKFLPIAYKDQVLLNSAGQLSMACAHEVSAVTAACMLVSKKAFDAVDGFDEQMAVGFGDVDLCLRIGQAGFRCIYSPDSILIHHESLTRGKYGGDPHPEDSRFFRNRWKKLLETGDPYYHPAYSKYSFSWQYADPLPYRTIPDTRVWKRIYAS